MLKKNEAEKNHNNLIALESIIRAIREEEDLDFLIKKVINYLQSEFDYCLIWVCLYDRLANKIVGKGGITPNGEISALKQKFTISHGDILEQVLMKRKAIKVADLRAEKQVGEWVKIAQTYHIKGTIFFPIHYKEKCFGIALMGSQEWGSSLESEEKALLSLIWGELGQTLQKIEKEWQHQQAKRPDEPILSLLSQLGKLTTLDQRLETVVEITHQFLQPSRTNIYWYYPNGRYFWRRASNHQVIVEWSDFKRPASGITLQDLGKFYHVLLAGKIVCIGEYYTSVDSDIIRRLIRQIRAASVLAAPIILEDELLGFIAVEEQHNRPWQDDEKNYLQGVGQLLALTSPLSEMEDKIRQAKLDQTLTAGITRAIYGDDDWQKTLKTTAEKISQRLGAKYFMLAIRNRGQFEVVYQNHSTQSRTVKTSLPTLSKEDMTLLGRNTEVVGIENWSESHILNAWQEDFEKLGVRSLLLCRTIGAGKKEQEEFITKNQGDQYNQPEGLVIIGYETPRTWNRNERELVQIASQQLGFLLHQRHINQLINKQQQYTQYLQSGLTALQPTTIIPNSTKVLINSSNSLLLQEVKNLEPVGELSVLGNLSLDRLEGNFLEFIAQAIVEIADLNPQTIPLVALITWYPLSQTGRVMSYSYPECHITSTDKISIPVRTDSWIQQIISTNGWLHLSVSDVPAKTLRWLNILDSGQVVATALRTAIEHQPTGILLIADPHKILWQKTELPQPHSPTETLKNLLTHLVSQFAWSRRYLIVKTALESQREELEWLNWYKQKRLEELYRTVGSGFKQLSELHYTPSENPAQQKNVLTNLRYQQLLRQIGNVLSSTTSLLTQEKWHLQANFDVVSVANLLRRSLIRIDSQVKKRQLQLEVHREGNLNIYGDLIKLELVVYELLISACSRSQTGGKIDIKCQTLDEEWLEISIIDAGKISSKLIAEFNSVSIPDVLEPSLLVSPPGKHLIICRRLIQQMGGELELNLQESGLVESKLLLPLAHL
ncbi:MULTISPECIES: GAF domain-containing protein [Okeania]|uniref:Sensor histidine kinase n=2 Tax=Okeania TaxID=1458928 RepID=A0A3N6QH39_9CYAN|nr:MULTISPECIES: GAF domain-containing protein [Okeania]NET16794.1 GAF domain-containing sensor histidine kinase [Okeania sp. SIO1H6]NES78191.1 GAF domain-containing sensor histidine kinase [Okeania sp. SIO1H4]NES91163.1 GAF domain-containing sensor histidine kinase [Okeania sp. SIO2B9]NET18747.1 GAF domain-containing sensor histidine kinase [Okeania sp. SIO1H5]NET78340.1 GAF domain-containing sensor histidine kinase [Okeania sp. SIO1F9]